MGHYCWMCGRMRPNERFSEKGRRKHLCKHCSRLPRAERDQRHALLEIEGFLDQRNISEKNIARLMALSGSPDPHLRQKAPLVLQLARVHPRKRKRLGYLNHHDPDLLVQLIDCGLMPHGAYPSCEWEPDPAEGAETADSDMDDDKVPRIIAEERDIPF